jgi:serine/threonine protein kinase
MKLPDDFLERFSDLELLGSGSMGRVYRAHDQTLDRPVAVKVLSPSMYIDGSLLRRFAREARAQAKVHHRHLVKIYDASIHSSPPFLVMEFVDGEDLEHRLRRDRLSLPATRRLAREIGGALDVLHSHGILHRDLKPANIMHRREDGGSVLMDLGLARVEDATQLTQDNSFLGTPLYMAPEVMRNQGWGPHSDQYQLALVLEEALTGRAAFSAQDLPTLSADIIHGNRAPWPEHLQVPALVRKALERGSSPTPSQRFSSCNHLAEALTKKQTKPRPALTRGMLSWKSGLALLGLFVLGLLWPGSPGPPRDIRYQVIGDWLSVEYQAASSQGVHLIAGEETLVPDPAASDQRQRILFHGLPQGRELLVQLLWKGGADARVGFRANPPAIVSTPQLTSGRQVVIEVRRPVQVRWQVAGGDFIPLEPGTHPLLSPGIGGRKEDWTLEWKEHGILFSHPWRSQKILQKTRLDFLQRTLHTSPDVHAWERFHPRGKPLPEDPEELQARLRVASLRGWITSFLNLPLSRLEHLKLLTAWQHWERAAHQSALLGAEETPLGLPPGTPGARIWKTRSGPSPPQKKSSLSFEPQDEFPSEEGFTVLTNTIGKRLLTSKYRNAASSVLLSWPNLGHLPPTSMVALTLKVHSFDPEIELSLAPNSQAPVWEISLWSQDVNLSQDEAFRGDLTYLLPARLQPPPGTRLRMVARRQLSHRPVLVALEAILIERWISK